MKKITAFILCFLLFFSSIPVQALEASPGFTQEVEKATDRCINLYPCEIDSYQRPITRGEFAVLSVNFVAALYGFGSAGDDFFQRYFTYHTDAARQPYKYEDYFKWPAQYGTYMPWAYLLRHEYRPFTDVPGTEAVNMTIRGAQLMGLVRGQRGGSYEPDRPIRRQEAAIMLGRIIYLYGPQLVNRQPVTYPDSAEIGEGPRPYVDIVSNANIMRGKGDGKFHPTDYFTIEQSLATFNRMYDLLEEQVPPLCDIEISFKKYIEGDGVCYSEILENYAIICRYLIDGPMNPSLEASIPSSYLIFTKISKKGGDRSKSMPGMTPANFRWDAENERLYFTDQYEERAYYFDAKNMKIVPLS